MNPLACEVNSVLEGTVAGKLLSGLGRRLFFPRGIIAQSAEAKKTARINATIGMAYDGGKPLILKAVAEGFPSLKPEESVVYAPTAGVETLRAAWKESLLRKNPSLKGKDFSLPVVVPGITAGISYAADLFLDAGDTMLVSDPCWDNYELVFGGRRAGILRTVSFFNGKQTLDISTLRSVVREEAAKSVVRLILNFPNNPSGYTPVKAEADALISLIADAAKTADILVLCDDAYFGLFYEDNTAKESLFAALCDLDKRVLAVKIDGPTKEDYVWGFRTAFLTFGSKGLGPIHHEALIKKLMAVIRSSVSCSNTAAQYLTLKALEDTGTAREKERLFTLLQGRYRAVRHFIADTQPPAALEVMPFNSGYFMSFRCVSISAEKLRRKLLEKGVGTIALGDRYLRVTFAALDAKEIPEVYNAIYQSAAELAS